MATIPKDYVNYKSTPIFTAENIPKMFLHRHNTRTGVYGKICVSQGQLKFYGFSDRRSDIEQQVIIHAGEVAISPPQYWHKVEFLTADTQFQVCFYAQKDSQIVYDNLNERDPE
ncbi:cytoplasmic protein [Photobacterium aquimaris]|uniref:DUF1971 domain-containing protein n=1 Tax=Photobacterium aquimaris TaxID=512643 RepID=A0A2T3IHG7_9GAMM|nr:MULTISPECIES: DUF1971 domain-containing protein [Photobacterium]OBU15957.1 cytoplasmic protein [Photobacterium aquimaris]OBU20445.1 cytoplasmic protein [Photobacterium aquimaris]PSU27088.1 DUF1971 domain-containing protein [Photobacterium aquimaris]PSV98535.1 DUF1971 domain-containing protein [Photobacterium aquimaris]